MPIQRSSPDALWRAIAVLPNLDLREAIEGGRAAVVPVTDLRVEAINRRYPNHQRFLESFTDAFGSKRYPAVLIAAPHAPKRFMTVSAMASFRDVLSMSVVPRSRALTLRYGRVRGIQFSRSFDFYPWALDRNYENLLAITPALRGTHVVSEFKGQSAPEMTAMSMRASDLDRPLFDELIKRWRRRYSTGPERWEDVALMRSLNMANQASQLPALSDTTMLDVGRMVALWVSAFEILVHPGPRLRSDVTAVCDQLERVPWEFRESRLKNLPCREKMKTVRRNLPGWLYHQLNTARNTFLHGNKISKRSLSLPRAKRSLDDFAAPLYRLALTAFLDLQWKVPILRGASTKVIAESISDRVEFRRHQCDFEVAVAMARGYELDRPRPKWRKSTKDAVSAEVPA